MSGPCHATGCLPTHSPAKMPEVSPTVYQPVLQDRWENPMCSPKEKQQCLTRTEHAPRDRHCHHCVSMLIHFTLSTTH